MAADQAGPTTVEPLLVRLTDDESLRKAEELARHLQETAQRKAQRAQDQKRFNEELKAREAHEAQLAADIASGTETRLVEVFEAMRFSDLLVDIVRADTHEVIRTRAMQPHERQTRMFDVPAYDDDDRDDPNPRAN